jgi:3-methyladenine DNA glycosylase AlkC
MPNLLKNLYTKQLVNKLGDEITKHFPAFDQKSFEQSVFNKDWKNKELKQRMRHIAECLHIYLPSNYKQSIKILRLVSVKFTGFEYMFFQDYVECFGLNDFVTSVSALEHFTKYASSEFAVRAFILKDEKRMMKHMRSWAKSDNHHVRRLASEGSRPRLPWAVALPAFKSNPRPVLAILQTLKNDSSEYVRRSVANNLNDISKDNPEFVLTLAKKWIGKNNNTDKIIKHACRTLLKQGNQRALALFGFTHAKHIKVRQFHLQADVAPGDKLPFSFTLTSQHASLGKCRIEFAIDFVKANGALRRKVFKISESDYSEKTKLVNKYFSFKKISTRKYYTGKHQLTVIVNGVEQISKSFILMAK